MLTEARTILVDGRRINSCLALAVAHQDAEILTIEGLAAGDDLHPLQRAFVEHDAFQCGYCTPGQICSAVAVLDEAERGWPSAVTEDFATTDVTLDDDEIRERMSGNLCRCAAYVNIVAGRPAAGGRVRPFRYERAAGAAAAVELLSGEPGAAFLAGGTNLVDLMKLDVERPDLLVDVTQATSDRIEPLPDGGVRIGSAVRNSDLAADAAIRERYPAMSQALLSGATYQLRNLATTGGNLMQRTRCVYFQDITKPCNKRAPGSGCAARRGYHRGLAILGHSQSCVATQPSDMAVALAAFDAVVRVEGPAGAREVPLVEFHRLPATSRSGTPCSNAAN